MSEYKVGHWYGWNGDDCPVHPLSKVAAVISDGKDTTIITKPAGEIRWFKDFTDLDCNVIAFKVIEEYEMPREFWVEVRPNGSVYKTHHIEPPMPTLYDSEIVKVAEVK